MVRKKVVRKKKVMKKKDYDLNKDGVFDDKDKSIAGKVLAKDPKEVPIEKPERYEAIMDINLIYRQGDEVPVEMVMQWKRNDLNVDVLVKRI